MRRHLAGAERESHVTQSELNPPSHRVRTAEYAPGDPRRILERRHGLAEIVGPQVGRRDAGRARRGRLGRGELPERGRRLLGGSLYRRKDYSML